MKRVLLIGFDPATVDVSDPARLERFRNRLKLPIARIIKGSQNNWQTYAMKGEWLRFKEGLVPRETAIHRYRKRMANEPPRAYCASAVPPLSRPH
jgi:hypothetical protein